MNIAVAFWFLLGLAFLSGCSSISQEESAVVRSFPATHDQALAAIEHVALEAGFKKINPYEYHLVQRTKHDPVLGLIEVSKEMDLGLGFTISIESTERASLVTASPVQIVRIPLTKAQYNRSPVRPGSKDHAAIVQLIEKAKARTEFKIQKSE